MITKGVSRKTDEGKQEKRAKKVAEIIKIHLQGCYIYNK
jgi:hypothetical protein